jgi:hypothetical protein
MKACLVCKREKGKVEKCTHCNGSGLEPLIGLDEVEDEKPTNPIQEKPAEPFTPPWIKPPREPEEDPEKTQT